MEVTNLRISSESLIKLTASAAFREGFIIMKPYRREDLQKIIRDALEFQE